MITMQDAAHMATTDPKLGRFMVAAAAALKSNDPIGAFTWLAEVEQDPDLRFGFENGIKLLRTREGGGQ